MGRSSEIDRWRGYPLRRHAIASAEVEELEDHLREQIEDPLANGLDHDHDHAFLVAIKRLGNLDAISREFAREHSDRLGTQLVLVPDDADATRAPAWRELAVVRGIALGSGLAVKAGLTVYGVWAAVVLVIFAPVFGFA
ncbi:permease prefix domain 1-containing protein [Cryobacterium sp. M91]|uniref:permease prefix domain 1-containing protein n=1 Tax=Cryobacterium sp. M91 TaxID=2048294 RepID=UPI000CE46E84|nr:permease prefix domain 1-containing protein [Cryobacterium sp. M91]